MVSKEKEDGAERVVIPVIFISSKVMFPDADNLCSEDTAAMAIHHARGDDGSIERFLMDNDSKGCFVFEQMVPCLPEEMGCRKIVLNSIEELKDELRTRWPVQLRFNIRGVRDPLAGHTKLGVGFDEREGVIIVHDQAYPKKGAFIEVPVDKFEREWKERGMQAIVCRPRSKEACESLMGEWNDKSGLCVRKIGSNRPDGSR